MSLVDSNSVDAVLTMGRYKIKGEINVMNAFVNRICVVQSVNRSNDLIQRYVSLPDILGSDLCSYVYFNEITVHGCLPDKFIDFHELSKSNKVTEKVIKQMVSWKGDAIDSTINVILGEDTHVKSFVINHGVSLYSGDLKTRVYFTNDYRKPTSEAEFSNYKLHHELKTNSGNFTQNILISPLDDTFRRVMFSLDWCYYGSIYTVECSSHHLTDVDLWLHICQLGQYAVEHWFELKNDSNDEVETLTDNEEALCGYDYTNLFTYIFINNKKIPTIHAEMLTTKRLIYIAIKTGVFFHLDLGIVWKTNLRDRVDTSSSGYLNHMDKSAKVCVPVNIQTALENLDKINFSIHWERKELIVFHENAGVIFKSPLDDCSFNERDFDHCSSTTVSNLTCLSNRYILTKCTVEEFRSIWHPQPFIVKIYLEHRGVSNLENIETEILVSLQDKRLYFTDMQYTESTDKMDSTITTILPSANLTVLLSNSNQTEVEDFQFPKDDVPKPPLLIVKPFQCHSLPGKFVLQCYRREIRFTWIPPDDKIAKAMVKFREFHQPKFTTMSDYGWGHSGVKFRNHTIASLKPNRFYEFGLNLIYENSTFDRFPKIGSKDLCTCKTYPDVPDVPLNLRYHYIQGNQYNLEWTPNNDNGEPIFTYNMKSMPIIPSNTEHSKWVSIAPHNLTDKQANITLDTNHQSAFQLRAVNKVGMSEPAYLVIRPPFQKVPDKGYSSLFQPLNQVTSLLTYSLLSVALLLLLLFLIVLLIYRRRHKDGKSNKHSFFISFNPARRLHSSSGNGSSILGLGSDLTTSGLPLDLATLEPLWNQEVNSLYGISKPDLNNFEQVPQIPAANIRFLRYIGCGAFGKVWEGWLHVRDADGERFEKVALKVRNCKSLTEAEFKREATLMHKYQHTNIVRFFGVSFDSPGQQCLVLEMMDQGNLRDYLHRSRPRIAPDIAANVFAAAAICAAAGKTGGSDGSSMNTSMTSTAAGGGTPSASNVITLTAQLDLPALVAIMRDICHGCRYLEEQHFVHRDIAARNCLVSHNHSSGRIVKLCDFGLARDIYKNDYYRKRNEPKLPVRWMSPEAIRDGLFTTKSDVWAYAVTCWEVLTLGADPFYGRANVDVMNLVIGGHVLGRPENCPEELCLIISSLLVIHSNGEMVNNCDQTELTR
uniref:receptor protein-tyrosine kinase n=1 Tax=Trichobilharzia regenti TaxID=157069 RepID=A0AA85IWT0_TRIRE|nr:unnamed protein product [Trichobilharzia regenti]